MTGISIVARRSPRVRALGGDPRVTDHFTHGEARWSLSPRSAGVLPGQPVPGGRARRARGRRAAPGGDDRSLRRRRPVQRRGRGPRPHPVVAVEGDDVSARTCGRTPPSWKGLLQITAHAGGGASAEAPRHPRPDAGAGSTSHRAVEAGADRDHRRARPANRLRVVRRADAGARYARRSSMPVMRSAQLRAFDLFPNTAHVETVAVLDLKGGSAPSTQALAPRDTEGRELRARPRRRQRDELLEERAELAGPPEVLGVPLHGQAEPARPGRSMRLDHAVRRGGVDVEARRQPLDRLMVPAVHLQALAVRACRA